MKLVIEGQPIAKDRHRCGCTNQKKPFIYDPQVKQEMTSVRMLMQSEWQKNLKDSQKWPKNQSFHVSFVFSFGINKSENLGHRNAKLWGLSEHMIKPDFDNLEKFYTDCLTGIAWDDDCQVVSSRSKKVYSSNPRTEIEIMPHVGLKVSERCEKVLMIFGPDKMKDFLLDVTAFWAWPANRVQEELGEHHHDQKSATLTSLALLVMEFAYRYGDDLKKIKKIEEL